MAMVTSGACSPVSAVVSTSAFCDRGAGGASTRTCHPSAPVQGVLALKADWERLRRI